MYRLTFSAVEGFYNEDLPCEVLSMFFKLANCLT